MGKNLSSPSAESLAGLTDSTTSQTNLQQLRSRRRGELGLTLKQASERSGISMSYYVDLERGLYPNPSIGVLSKLSIGLDMILIDVCTAAERSYLEKAAV